MSAGIVFAFEADVSDDNGGDFRRVEVPGRYDVCPRCEGRGSHVNPAVDGHGITADEWNGPDWDDDSREAYMRGAYDVACYTCAGARVVLVPDLERCSDEQRERVEAFLNARARDRRERESAVRYGY